MRFIPAVVAALAAPALAFAQVQQEQVASVASGSHSGPGIATHATARATVAIRATHAPVLDGRGDDAVWASAQVIDQFREFEPVEDKDPRFRTEAKVAYDDRNVYVFVRAFDPHPDSISALLSRRDEHTASDYIRVGIDSYHDRRTAYTFAVNPAGVKSDSYIFNDGDEDDSWNAVWDVATRTDSLGWTAEFRIPLSQLRYPSAASHTFGIVIVRDIARYSERESWPVLRKSRAGLASQFGDVAGIDGIASPRQLEISPYTVAKSANVVAPAGGYQMQSKATMGADLKYGITSNLTLDATVNPDFGQVEADPSTLNLSAFETFYPEKRPFFLEGQGLFRFDLNCNDGACSGLFYSRRIGRAPQMDNEYGVFGDAGNPTSTQILGAGKLTGRLGHGISLGLLNATTRREVAPGDHTIEPQTNYFVGRVQKDRTDGTGSIGVMATSVNRQLDADTRDYLRRTAFAGGIDARQQFLDRKYEVSALYARSVVNGSDSAIAYTQRSSVHFFQRPDDARFDPSRTSLTGDAAMVTISKIGGDFTRFNVGYQRFSPGFEINDIGYLSQANMQAQFGWFQLRGDKPTKLYRNYRVNVNQWGNWTADGLRTEVGGNVNVHVMLNSQWWLHAGQGVNAAVPSDCATCLRGGPALRQDRSFWGWAGIDGDSRKVIVPHLFSRWATGDGGRSHGLGIDPSLEFRIASRFNAELGLSYGHDVNATQPLGNYGDIGSDTTHYTIGRLDQHTLSATTRFSFTATPNLSIQVYAQPFVTAGAFSDWMEVSNPRADQFTGRYRPYSGGLASDNDFNFKQYRSNTVVRWEYRPGSTLYFVWAQERTQSDLNLGTFSARRDYGNLFRAHPGNVFLIKGSYWLSL